MEHFDFITTVTSHLMQAFHTTFFSSFVESEDDDDDDIIEILIRRAQTRVKRLRRRPSRINNYVQRTIPQLRDNEFQRNFRVTRQVFDLLLGKVSQDLINQTTGRPTIDPKRQLLSTLWLLATPDSYRSVAERFDMGKASLYVSFRRIIVALNKLSPSIIKWPNGQERNRSIQEFQALAGIQKVSGAIDGTYIPIKAPSENPEVYINRKCFHALTLQAICDSRRRFIDCFVGYPSSVSDNRIFRNSDIFREICQNQEHYFNRNEFIIGDKAYPLLEWCITPYIDRGNLGDLETNFNTSHAKTRQVIERSFALLFGRLRRLRYLDMNRTDLCPATIIGCCVIHNICLSHPDDLEDIFENEGRQHINGEILENDFFAENNLFNRADLGAQIRDNIARNLLQ